MCVVIVHCLVGKTSCQQCKSANTSYISDIMTTLDCKHGLQMAAHEACQKAMHCQWSRLCLALFVFLSIRRNLKRYTKWLYCVTRTVRNMFLRHVWCMKRLTQQKGKVETQKHKNRKSSQWTNRLKKGCCYGLWRMCS